MNNKEEKFESLEDFLIERDYSNQVKKYVLEKDGHNYEVVYKSLPSAKYGELKLKCRTVDSNGKVAFDEVRFYCEVIAYCCTKPNFNDTSYISKAKCTTPVQFISMMFAPIEIEIIANAILANSGVDSQSQEEVIETVKKL